MNDTASVPAARNDLASSVICRGLVPAWLLAGAAIKLQERSPMLLPSPVRDALKSIATSMGKGGEAEFASFLDLALRIIVSGEFALAAAMVLLPRLSRPIAMAMLSLFVVILLTVVARGEASCGCFGSKGPPPWAVLIGDTLLLADNVDVARGLTIADDGAGGVTPVLGGYGTGSSSFTAAGQPSIKNLE